MRTPSPRCPSVRVSSRWRAEAQTYDTNNVIVQTFAGSGFDGYLDGTNTLTMFSAPTQIVADSAGNLFVLDSGNARIRKIDTNGVVSTFCGGGAQTSGFGTNATIGSASGAMAIDHSNTIWLISGNSYLLKIEPNGFVSRPITNSVGFSTSGGLCFDSANNLYYTTPTSNQFYRYFANGQAELFVGSGNSGSIDGNGVFTSFNSPRALAADSADNIYVFDYNNHLIRRINQNRDVVTIAGKKTSGADLDGVGTNATFSPVIAMSVDSSGNLLLTCGECVRKMTATTNVVTMAGSFSQTGYTNGAGSIARFRFAYGVCVSLGTIFVSDSTDQRIRNLSFDPVPLQVSGPSLSLNTYAGLQINGVVGRTYRIESSTDLNMWNLETTILLTSTPFLWIDPNGIVANKSYRAFLLP